MGLFWVLVGGGRFILGGSGWWRVILRHGECWWVGIFWTVVSCGG